MSKSVLKSKPGSSVKLPDDVKLTSIGTSLKV